MEHKFKIGDKVRCFREKGEMSRYKAIPNNCEVGATGTIKAIDAKDDQDIWVTIDGSIDWWAPSDCWELIENTFQVGDKVLYKGEVCTIHAIAPRRHPEGWEYNSWKDGLIIIRPNATTVDHGIKGGYWVMKTSIKPFEKQEEEMHQKYYDHDNQIAALKKTLAKHAEALAEGKTYRGGSATCPLCIANNAGSDCDRCAWGQITGRSCGAGDYGNSAKRITEILKWIEMFEEDKLKQPATKEPQFVPFTFEVKDYNTYLAMFCLFNAGNPKYKEIIELFIEKNLLPDGLSSMSTEKSPDNWYQLVDEFQKANTKSSKDHL